MSARYNLLSPELKANPYPAYAQLRREAPVCQVDPGGMWAVSRYDDVVHVLKNPRVFSSAGFRLATNPPWLGGSPFSESMLVMDPPQHGRLRALVNRAFTGPALTRLESRVRAFAEQAVAELPLGQPFDIIPSFALRLPASVLGELLGLDAALHARLKLWADRVIGVTTVRPDELERQQQARDAVAELKRYLGEVLESRRRQPGEDMVSELLRARVDGEALTEDELMAFLFLLLVGGLETATHMLGLSVLRLAEHPELLARLRADTSRVPRFVDELLRYESPGQALIRVTTEEVELGGVRLPKGARVLALVASANRDDAYVPEAERFDLERPGPLNLHFGQGAHFCLGAQLARLEGRLGLEALLARCGRVERVGEPVEWHRTMVVRGPASLRVVLHPA